MNLRGELVGINTAIASPTGSYSGYSFAIPSDLVKKVVEDLKEFGTVQRGLLGVIVRDVDDALAKEKGLPLIAGVYVEEVNEGSAADGAGIRKGDVLLKVNGKEINSVPELQEAIGRYRPGQKVKVRIRRGKQEQDMPLILKDVAGSMALSSSAEQKSEELGAVFSPADPVLLKRAGVSFGLKIDELQNGPLEEAGLEEGLILYRLDKKPFRNLQELLSIFIKGKGGMLLEAMNEEGNKRYFVLVKP